MSRNIKIINNLDEITEIGVAYAHIAAPLKWIRIDEDSPKEFSVFGLVSGPHETSISSSHWNRVKIWKTFKGTINSLKKYSIDGGWGMSHWNNKP